MKTIMMRAWQIRREAAASLSCRVGDVLMSECLRMAWREHRNIRRLYRLTKGDLKRSTISTETEYAAKLAAFDSEKARLGKRFGLRKRDHASKLLRSTLQYAQGKGQGLMDRLSGIEYMADSNSSESFQNAYNLGYYTGWNTNSSNARELIQTNNNFSHLR